MRASGLECGQSGPMGRAVVMSGFKMKSSTKENCLGSWIGQRWLACTDRQKPSSATTTVAQMVVIAMGQ